MNHKSYLAEAATRSSSSFFDTAKLFISFLAASIISLARQTSMGFEFLYDEFIHNPLLQEQRWYRKNKDKVNNYYPYERAEAMSRTIKKLGRTQSGMLYIDKFR